MRVFLLAGILFLGSPPAKAQSNCPTAQEKSLVKLINSYRQSKGLPSIAVSEKLTLVAHLHADDLERYYDKKANADCNLHSWSANGTWTSCCYTRDHAKAECMWQKPREIVGMEADGYEIAAYGSAGLTASEALEGWKSSRGHHEVIINEGIWKEKNWKSIGVGISDHYTVVWFVDLEDQSNCLP